MRPWIDILLFKYLLSVKGSSYISLPSSYLYLCIYQYLITTPSSYYARQLVVTRKLVLVYVLTSLKIYYCPHNEIFFSAITL
uniref:SJCHGC03747 protein n=1 Tax=Schistosoma japonicum TaxID=6182 RepID=Q5BSN1_SCHJA|nr:SJCHGC03747 protein [Schistosoma japonicum]